MTTKERIRAKMLEKGWLCSEIEWEHIYYDYSGRNGGWLVSFHEKCRGFMNSHLALFDENYKIIESIPHPGFPCIITGGFISAYNKDDLFKVIELLPVALEFPCELGIRTYE